MLIYINYFNFLIPYLVMVAIEHVIKYLHWKEIL